MLALLRLDPSLFPDGGSAGTTAAAVFEEALDAADALRLEEADLVRLRTDEDAKLQVCAKLIYGWQCRWNGFGFGDRCRYRSCVHPDQMLMCTAFTPVDTREISSAISD